MLQRFCFVCLSLVWHEFMVCARAVVAANLRSVFLAEIVCVRVCVRVCVCVFVRVCDWWGFSVMMFPSFGGKARGG